MPARPRHTKFYEVLGLKDNFTPTEAELKKAYRKAAMKVSSSNSLPLPSTSVHLTTSVTK